MVLLDEQPDHPWIFIPVENGISQYFCPLLKRIGKIFLLIKNDFQDAVFGNPFERFRRFVRRAEKGKPPDVQCFKYVHDVSPVKWADAWRHPPDFSDVCL